MALLLDTHIVLAVVEERPDTLPKPLLAAIQQPDEFCSVSVASIWEIAIKSRLGKLPIETPLVEWPYALRRLGFALLPIDVVQILADIGPEPPHRDPFDRLLLGVCAAKGFRLVTVDRALIDHPLAWRPT